MKTKIEILSTVIGTNGIENPRFIIAIHEGRRTWYVKKYNMKTHYFELACDKLYGRPWSMATIKKIMKAENISKYTIA